MSTFFGTLDKPGRFLSISYYFRRNWGDIGGEKVTINKGHSESLMCVELKRPSAGSSWHSPCFHLRRHVEKLLA